MNKQIADHHLASDQRQYKNSVRRQNEDLDDLRSESSFQTSQSSIMGRSNFSSALKKGPAAFLNTPGMGHTNQHDISSNVSQVSIEDGYANAEYNAIKEELDAKKRKEDEERKLQEFQEKTKKNAQKKLKEEIKQREKQEIEKQMKDKERIVKAKDYADKQRQLIKTKTNKRSKLEVISQSEVSQDPAGEHTNFHVHFNKVNNDVIAEVLETEERTHIEQSSTFQQPKDQKYDQLDLKELYLRIDQEELEKLGVADKQDISEKAFKDLHEYSQLQRFRQNKDLTKIDQAKKTGKKGKGVQEDKENKWWLENKPSTLAEKRQQVEKGRYLKALKALVYEKGEKLDGGEIPNLCSCGALGENLKEMKRGNKGANVQMCASNCQFYKNEKDYEKALRDILHSISQFK